jgi:NAD(P)-dependent dehydrogenase (short-subunit alcohol dehydrogenase family)
MGARTKRPLLAAFGRSIALQIAVAIIGGCLAIVCTMALVLLVGAAAESNSDIAMAAAIAAAVCIPTALLGGAVLAVVLVISRRGRRFDALFEPLGLTGSMYGITGRQYRGIASGRQVHITFYRGPGLNIDVSSSLQTRFAIGTRTGLGQAASGLFQSRAVPLDDPDYGHLMASAHDEAWARSLLADPAAKAAILRLTRDVAATEIRSLTIQPGKMQVTIYRFLPRLLTAENAQMWLDDLLALAELAEKRPPPSGLPGA